MSETVEAVRAALNEVRGRHLQPVTQADAFDAAVGDALNDAERTIVAALASIPAEPEQADEVAGLREALMACAQRFWPALDGGPDYSDDVLYRKVEGLLWPSVTQDRLAPARDDTSGGAS